MYRLSDFYIYFCSKPSCTDIMEIYNAVEEMDEDEEVRNNVQLDAGCFQTRLLLPTSSIFSIRNNFSMR